MNKEQEDFYKEHGIDETMLWSNNKRRSKGLPMFRQCGYHKRKKKFRINYLGKHQRNLFYALENEIEKLLKDIFKDSNEFFNSFIDYNDIDDIDIDCK